MVQPSAVLETSSAPAPQLVCERCGGFAAFRRLAREQKLCADCYQRVEVERLSQKFYPSGFLWAVGILGNGTLSSALAALNWSRYGDAKRAKSAWMLTAGCALLSVLVMSIHGIPSVVLLVASVTATRMGADGWKPLYEAHRRAGGRRASLLLPIAILLGVLTGVAVTVAMLSPAA